MISRRRALLAGGVAAVGAGAAAVVVANREKPEPPSPPSTEGGRLLWRNWSGIQHAYPQARLTPQSEADLPLALAAAVAPIRPVGAGHSFTGLSPTTGTLISIDSLSGVSGWDGDQAIVKAGTRLGALGPALAERGRAMANLPDINKQSLAGAISTATHGTGARLPAIHADITELALVTPEGSLVECSATRRPEVLEAAKVSLGALGVIIEAKLRTIPNRRVRRRVWVEPLETTLAKSEERWAAHRNYEFYAVPFTGLAAAITHDETDDPVQPQGESQDGAFLEVLRSLRNLLGFSNALRRSAAQALLAGAEPETAVDEGWKLLSTERPERFNEMEYHLPAEAHLTALKEVIETIERERPDVFFPVEARRIAPDEAWLSPFQGGPRGSIAVHAHYKDDYAFLFELIEPIFLRHGGRPHWGKLHSLHGQQLAALYPRWNDFLEVRRELDPKGRMLNPYLTGLFGLA